MSKRLILILALACVIGIASYAYAEVQNVKVSGDISVYGIKRDLSLRGPDNDATVRSVASIARVKVDADLTDNVMTTVRLLNERYWGKETDNSASSQDNTTIALDLANVTLKEFLYSPLTVTVGRQELHYGSEMIVGDYDTNNTVSAASPFSASNRDRDLSARKAFDAIRAVLNYDPLVIDTVWALVEDTLLNTSDNVDLFGVQATYKLSDKYKSVVDGYWFEKRIGGRNNVTAKKEVIDRTDVVGGRIVTNPIADMTYSLEAAYQFGKYGPTANNKHAVKRKAWALETALNYAFKKVKYTPSLTAMYSYFSGDHLDPNATFDNDWGAYRGWNPMYENQKSGDIANALFAQTNAHIAGAIATAKPMDDITLKGEYYAYWWAKAYQQDSTISNNYRATSVNLIMTERRFAGSELDLTAMYDYTEDVQLALMGGLFFPGPSFSKSNNDTATELIGSMKVTF